MSDHSESSVSNSNADVVREWVDKHGDYTLVPVPKKYSKRLLTLAFIYMSMVADIAEIWGGGIIGSQFNVKDALIVCLVGSLILACLGGALAYIGGVTRCSSYVNFRFAFGVFGSKIFSTLASTVPNIGWFAILAWLFGVIMHSILPDVSICGVLPATIWGGSLMVITAYFGFKGLAVFSYLAVPFFILLAAFGLLIGVHGSGGFSNLFELEPVGSATYGEGITMVVGMMMALCLITADVCRFGKSRWSGVFAWSSAMVLQVVLLVGAAMLTLFTGESDVPGALMAAGVGLGAFVMILLGQWSTNDTNLYSASLSVSMYVPLQRKYVVLIVGAIGVTIAALIASVWGRAMDPLEAFLEIMGTILPGVAGVVIADFYIFQAYKKVKMDDRYKNSPGSTLPAINWLGWLAAVISIVVGGFVITGGIPALNTLFIGLGCYALGSIVCDRLSINTGIGVHTLKETGE